jgi:KaiC/GvpD/RAD55 family RecA-like ATPase
MRPRFDLENIVASFCKQILLEQSALQKILTSGVNPLSLSIGSNAIDLFKAFVSTTESRSYLAARVELRNKIDDLYLKSGLEGVDLDELIFEYPQSLKAYRARNLADALYVDYTKTEQAIATFLTSETTTEVRSFDDINQWVDQFVTLKAEKQLKTILPDFPILSSNIGGFNGGRLSILFADTGFGKTNIAIQFALSSAKLNPTLYINMEMNEFDFTHRLVVASTGCSYKELEDKDLDLMKISAALNKNLYFTLGSSISLSQLTSVILAQWNKNKTKFVVVDYDQKLVLENSKEEEWKLLQRAAQYLEELAKKLGIHIMLLAQSNFDGGLSGSKRIQFGAFTVMRFHRTEDGETSHDVVECIKNRGGPSGFTIKVVYDRARAWIKEAEVFEKPKHRRRSLI